MKPKILLVNPPIYDFAAYDFWLKPYGLLKVAGYVQSKAEFALFDYLDRLHPFYSDKPGCESDKWGRGRFFYDRIPNPPCLEKIPRFYRRFGLPKKYFADFLKANNEFEFAFVETAMTYWYPGVKEVIDDIREVNPAAKIILGGNYATICPNHTKKLGADLVIEGDVLEPLWDLLNIEPDLSRPALWQAYNKIETAAQRLSDGCPFNCSYCSVPKVYGQFQARPLEHSLAELKLLYNLGVKNIAF